MTLLDQITLGLLNLFEIESTLVSSIFKDLLHKAILALTQTGLWSSGLQAGPLDCFILR